MTTRRPHLPGAPTTAVEPVVNQPRDGSDDVRHVPAGLDSRGFALHRIFCMAGEPRCKACLEKFGITESDESTIPRITRTLQADAPLGAGVRPGNDMSGIGIEIGDVVPNSNAAKAGLRPLDQLISVNGVQLAHTVCCTASIEQRFEFICQCFLSD
eukprot:m.80737 g.80737  ORF g.80737 m.80737 type:complete len:156 (+) comp16311_c0_seq2:257-724(+)